MFATAVIIFICVLLRIYGRARAKAMQKVQAKNRNEKASVRYQEKEPHVCFTGNIPDSVSKWEVEMHKLGREILGRIDTKLVVLQTVTEDAKRSADILESLILKVEKAKSEAEQALLEYEKKISVPIPERAREEIHLFREREPSISAEPINESLRSLKMMRETLESDIEKFHEIIPDNFSQDRLEEEAKTVPFTEFPEKTIPIQQESRKYRFDELEPGKKTKSSSLNNLDSPVPQVLPFETLEETERNREKRVKDGRATVIPGPGTIPINSAELRKPKRNLGSGSPGIISINAAPRPQLASLVGELREPHKPEPPRPPKILRTEPEEPQIRSFPQSEISETPAIPEDIDSKIYATKVRMLANYGYSAKDIAYQLNISKEIVENILRVG